MTLPVNAAYMDSGSMFTHTHAASRGVTFSNDFIFTFAVLHVS